MATLDQDRAQIAFKSIAEVKGWKDEGRAKKYASIVHAMPALLRSAGLSQALHFVRSRKNKEQQLFLDHLAGQLGRVDATIKNADTLLGKVRDADLPDYLRLTHEALACVTWYRRFVQGELNIQAGDVDADD